MSNKDEYSDDYKIVHHMPGMSLRDWFAGMALQGLLATPFDERHYPIDRSHDEENRRCDAKYCYQMADAMLKEREK